MRDRAVLDLILGNEPGQVGQVLVGEYFGINWRKADFNVVQEDLLKTDLGRRLQLIGQFRSGSLLKKN